MDGFVFVCAVLILSACFVFSDWSFRSAMIIGMIIGLAWASSDAKAATIGVHTFSNHGKDTHAVTHEGGDDTYEKFNNKNWGLYYIADSGLTLGGYDNSYDKWTMYVGWTWTSPNWGPLRASVTAALATGYQSVHGVGILRPIVMPSVLLDLPRGTAVRWSIAPNHEKGFFQHLSFEWSF